MMNAMSFFWLRIGCYWERFRKWGVKGVCSFFISKYKKMESDRRILALAPKPYPKPIHGFTLVGTFSKTNSLSKVMRDLAYALKQVGIPYQILDLSDEQNTALEKDLSEINIPPYKDIHLCKYTNILEMEDCPLPLDAPVKRSRICFWEFDTGLVEEFPALLKCREIIGMSDYNCEVFRKTFPPTVAVRKMLYPFRANVPALESVAVIREKYGLGRGDFVVFFNFDFESWADRKNPEGAMHAFAHAFKDTQDAKLVFKTMNAKRFPDQVSSLQNLAETLGIDDRFMTINNYIPTADLYGLTNACDVYISLHRGEGFGLGIAEAMSLGKPVVVTDYSSTTEFCNKGNAIVVPYKVVSVPQNAMVHPNYLFVKKWAEPDICAAANGLKRLYDEPEYREQLGKKAKATIEEYFSLGNFKDSVMAFWTSCS